MDRIRKVVWNEIKFNKKCVCVGVIANNLKDTQPEYEVNFSFFRYKPSYVIEI